MEKSIDQNVCLVCGTHLPSVTEAQSRIKSLIEQFAQDGLGRAEILSHLQERVPLLMRRIGQLSVVPIGHCCGCGKSLKSAEEVARELLEESVNSVNILLVSFVFSFIFNCPIEGQQRTNQSASKRPAKRRLFNVDLSHQTVLLLEQVEAGFGSKVVELRNDDHLLASYSIAESYVDEDGRPIINISMKLAPTEAVIAHELIHHKHRLSGRREITRIRHEQYKSIDSSLPLITATIRDHISHLFVNQEVLEMGIDPTPGQKQSLKARLQLNEAPYRNNIIGHAIDYFGFATGLGNDPLVSELTEWYKKQRLFVPLDLGQQMLEFIQTSPPPRIQDEVYASVECLNILYKGTYRFRLEDTGEIKRYKKTKYTQHNLTLLISDPS